MTGHSGVTVVITGKIKPDKLDLARAALQAVIPEVIAKEFACHSIRLHEDPNDPCRLLIIEQWDSIEAFTGPHMQTPHQKASSSRLRCSSMATPISRSGARRSPRRSGRLG